MQREQRPTWLLRQEHGVLAEARTRALLLERFWILERSVDVEGADFIVQRRLTRRSLLDPQPPRLGFIQSKYYADVHTTHYVHREYLLDADGRPRGEFFLMCHTGREDSAATYLLSASEVSAMFKEAPAEHSRAGRFVLPGGDLLVQRFAIVDKATALDRIERALTEADFYSNRRFFSWALPSVDADEPPVLEEYWAPIDNWWGDIPSGLRQLRDRARRARWNLEEAVEKLRAIETTGDPEAALSAAEEIYHDYRDHVSIPDDLWNDDFWSAVQYHKTRHQQLKDAGLMSAYAAIRRQTADFMLQDLAPQMPLDRDSAYVLLLRYDGTSLLRVRLQARVAAALQLKLEPWSSFHPEMPANCALLTSAPGQIEVYLLAGRYGYEDYKNGQWVERAGPWSERLKDVVAIATSTAMEELLKLRFGEA